MFSDKLRQMRKKMGITQAKLAKKLKVSPSTIGMYEQGRREPDAEMLVKMAKFFDVSVDYLVGASKCHRNISNIDELAEQIGMILKEQYGLKISGEPVNSNKIKEIVEAVRQGIHQAFENNMNEK